MSKKTKFILNDQQKTMIGLTIFIIGYTIYFMVYNCSSAFEKFPNHCAFENDFIKEGINAGIIFSIGFYPLIIVFALGYLALLLWEMIKHE